MNYAMIMAGGSGTRLWPLSRKAQPKQTLVLSGERSFYQLAVDRLAGLVSPQHVLTVANATYTPMLQAQAADIPGENFIVEPEGRGTAAAIGLAAIHLRQRDPQAVMMVLTADHYIADVPAFQRALRAAVATAHEDWLVTLGIQPSYPATGYGYIQQAGGLAPQEGLAVFQVERFVEKPDLDNARRMLAGGGFSWNSGMFIWKVEQILAEFQRQMPGLYAQLTEIEAAIGTPAYPAVLARVWPQIQKQTIDYGVMEHAQRIAVVPAEIGWTDIGSWASLYDLLPADEQGNRWTGPHAAIDTNGSLVYSPQRLVAAIGLQNIIIVDTPDALLVCSKEREQDVKKIVDLLTSQGQARFL